MTSEIHQEDLEEEEDGALTDRRPDRSAAVKEVAGYPGLQKVSSADKNLALGYVKKKRKKGVGGREKILFERERQFHDSNNKIPTEHLSVFRALKSVDWRVLCCSETSIGGFRSC